MRSGVRSRPRTSSRLDLVNNRLIGARDRAARRASRSRPGADKLTLYYARRRCRITSAARSTEQLGIAESAHARDRARCRRRLRLQGQALSGGGDRRLGGAPAATPGALGRRPAARASSPTTRRRDHLTHAELALDARRPFPRACASRPSPISAPMSRPSAPPFRARSTARCSPASTARPRSSSKCTGVFTNTVPTDAYRGAGRPEACYVLERLADSAAQKLGIDRAEIRRRNLIPPSAMPYKTPIGPTYDCGDFPKIFARALRARRLRRLRAAPRGRRQRAAAARHRHRLLRRIVGRRAVALRRRARRARRLLRSGRRSASSPTARVRALLGTHNHGQGHATTFAQILVVAARRADRARSRSSRATPITVPYGTGTFGSRSIAVGGSALDRAADKIIAKGKLIAAHLLEAADGDVDFADGAFVVAGTDRARRVRGGRARRLRAAQLSARDARAGPAGHRGLRSAELRLQQRRACLRGRDRSARPARSSIVGYWARRRRRHRHQPDDRRGPDPRRPRAGPRPGAAASTASTTASGQLVCRLVHGLRACRAPTTCRASSPSATRASPAPTIRSAPRAAARPARSARPPRSSARCSMRSRRSASTDLDMPLTPERVWQAIASARGVGTQAG